MVARRRAGEPLQYVLGAWSFRMVDLLVDRRVLIPRPETEAVVEVALAELPAPAGDRTLVAVDLGTGSGAIALSLAVERPDLEVWGTDSSAAALEVARANLSGLAGRAATRVTLAGGSWFEALPDRLRGAVDLVVSNPPYVAVEDEVEEAVAAWEPAEALYAGGGGLEATESILAAAPGWLADGGVVVLEVASQRWEDTEELARALGYRSVDTRPDLAGRPRALVARP